MSKITFDYRFIFDSDFYEENKEFPKLLLKLMYISANSQDHKKCHNVMSRQDFNKVVKVSTAQKEFLRLSFKPVEEPEIIENVSDDVVRNIKYAVYFSNHKPLRTILFTSTRQHDKYTTNSHLVGIKNVVIRSGSDALAIINEYYQKVTSR